MYRVLNGFAACKQLRDQGVKAPIIMLTGAAQEEEQQVQGLDAGANDYVLKPFKFSVLLARIRAHLRSHEASEDDEWAAGHAITPRRAARRRRHPPGTSEAAPSACVKLAGSMVSASRGNCLQRTRVVG